jgi:hypothetical protein
MSFPWGLLSTTVVGLGGIGGTVFAARMTAKSTSANIVRTINAERDLAVLAEKRNIYATCHAAVLPLQLAYAAVGGAERRKLKLREQPTSDDRALRAASAEVKDMRAELDNAYSEFSLRLSTIRLIAPHTVAAPVMAVLHSILQLREVGREDNTKGLDYLKWTAKFKQLEEAMIRAMRADLGVSNE